VPRWWAPEARIVDCEEMLRWCSQSRDIGKLKIYVTGPGGVAHSQFASGRADVCRTAAIETS
jgi:hypothetical protein